jgi:membrane glycosyltransferase
MNIEKFDINQLNDEYTHALLNNYYAEMRRISAILGTLYIYYRNRRSDTPRKS